MSDPSSPKTTDEAAQWLRDEVESSNDSWYRKCLILQRTARGIPAMYPTALSASQAVPDSERVYDTSKWRRGMVGFSYDPRVPGTAGHIFFIAGRDNETDEIITCSNDVKQSGHVDYVPLSFYERVWYHKIQFAASWLNGYDFKDDAKPAKPTKTGSLGDQYVALRDDLQSIIDRKSKRLGPTNPLVIALKRDLKTMDERLRKYGKPTD